MMKFATAKEHRNYFRRERHVGFECLLTEQQCAQLNSDIDKVLSQRLELRNASSLSGLTADKLFSQGRDLWRADHKLKKIILNRAFAQAAADLIEQKPLRIGYDQLLLGYIPVRYPSLVPNPYSDFLKQTATLPEISCIQGVVCGLMLCLKAPPLEDGIDDIVKVFPRVAGQGVFIASDHPIDFSILNGLPDARYLMIVYSQAASVYCHEERDPQIHYFRSLGYNFGDRLSEQLNPLVFS